MTGPKDEDSDPYKWEDYGHKQEKPKVDKMGKLKRELEFLERGMQRVKTKLQKLLQDPMLTPSSSTVGLIPKQFVNQHYYDVVRQSKVKIHMIMIDTLVCVLQ